MYKQTCNLPDVSYCFRLPRCWERPQLNYPNSGDAFPSENWRVGVCKRQTRLLRKEKGGAVIQSNTKLRTMEVAKCSGSCCREARNSLFPSPKA